MAQCVFVPDCAFVCTESQVRICGRLSSPFSLLCLFCLPLVAACQVHPVCCRGHQHLLSLLLLNHKFPADESGCWIPPNNKPTSSCSMFSHSCMKGKKNRPRPISLRLASKYENKTFYLHFDTFVIIYTHPAGNNLKMVAPCSAGSSKWCHMFALTLPGPAMISKNLIFCCSQVRLDSLSHYRGAIFNLHLCLGCRL